MSELNEALREFGFLIRPISGDSMMPMLDQRTDTVKIVPVTGKLKKYDLPLYRRENGQYVLHRIIGVRKWGYIICGDNRTEKERVPFSSVIGVTEGFFRNGKYVSCQDPTYLKYVRRRVAERPLRRVRELCERVKKKLKKK